MTKKILVLTENFPPLSGGSGRWFWELYSRLPQENILVVADQHPNSEKFDKTHDVPIIRLPLRSTEWGLISLKGLAFYWQCIQQLRKTIKQHHITEIHCGRVIHEGVTAWLLKKLTGTPYLCFVHGEDIETAATSREHKFIVKRVFDNAEMIICNSANSSDIAQRLNFATAEKSHILHPGVDANRFIPAEEDLSFKEQMGWVGRKVIITVGRLQKRKGQDMMIKAMQEIRRDNPDALYVIIGNGDCKEELTSLILDNDLESYVQILDDVTDEQMIQCYQQCILFVLPNRTIGNDIEGFGMVLVEAQSCGKPVVGGDSGGTRETMIVGKSGIIIDCTNEQNIAKHINELLSQPELIKNMGLAGREHVVHNLDWQAHTDQARKLFKL